jgi:hypothetical protein
VAEAFTNAAKHAQASELIVMANADENNLAERLAFDVQRYRVSLASRAMAIV